MGLVTNLVSVTWLDAADHTDISLTDLGNKSPKSWLMKRTTYGKLFKENKDVIILIRDQDSEDDCEITVIPKPWVIEVKE